MTQLVVDINALAQLARINVSDEEIVKLSAELPSILSMVETVQQVISERQTTLPEHRNIMREDVDSHVSGLYTQDLLQVAPAQSDNRIMVKQVINRAR